MKYINAPVITRHKAAVKSAANGTRALRPNMEINKNTILIVHMSIALITVNKMEYCHKLQLTAAVLKLLTAYNGRLPPSVVPKEKTKPIIKYLFLFCI